MTRVTSWAEAWDHANAIFYGREIPRDHFETSVHPGPELAWALASLAVDTDERLGNPARFDLIDVGAGDGELMSALLTILREMSPELARRCAPVAVDLRPPSDLDPRVTWWVGDALQVLHHRCALDINGMVMAHEWLDDLAADIVESVESGDLHYINVDVDSGLESLGEPVGDDEQRAWLHRWWWPVIGRAEIGLSRDRAWQQLCSVINRGRAVAIDYSHTWQERSQGDFARGTVRAYRDGRRVQVIPNGSSNITAHVALDACAEAVGGSWTLSNQRTALSRMSAPMPDPAQADENPAVYAEQLQTHLRLQALRRIPGPGTMTWLIQEMGMTERTP